MSFKYMLRLCLQPGFHNEEKLQEAITFCKEAKIDDVMFFISVEEISKGFLTKEETEPWLQMISTAKPILAEHGITTSLNPWMTIGHMDRGRQINPALGFRPMVDRYGNAATSQVCPLDSAWREYIADMNAFYASIKPNIIWVDDDFRLHNHHPLVWGGCFCDLHMAEYSRRAGKELSREEFITGVLRQGEPHPYRQIWLDTSRDTMVDLAHIIGDSIRKVSPATKVGLMSSSPAVHCAEGRDWEGVLRGFSGPDLNPVNRLHLPAYRETLGQSYVWGFNITSRRTQASVPVDTELYPELESFPDTRFTKSRAFTQYQIETSTVLGARGITFNIFDMMGNGVMSQEGYQKALAASKDFADRVTSLGINRSSETGVKVLTNSQSSRTIHTSAGNYMEEIYPAETFWSGMLSSFGIANTYAVDEVPSGGAAAISGQYLRNLMASEIKLLFDNNFVILNGDAASVLFEMGCGDLAGIKNIVWRPQETGYHSYEQVCDGRVYCGLKDTRISTQSTSGDLHDIEYFGAPDIRSAVKNPTGATVANGVTVYDNRVFILPYGHFGDAHGGIYQTHMHPLRQEMLQETLKSACADNCPMFISGVPYVSLYTYNIGGKTVLIAVNSSGDDLDEVRIYAPELNIDSAKEINRNSEQGANICRDGDYIIWKSGFRNLETKVLVV